MLTSLSVMDFSWPIKKELQHDCRERICELENSMAVFVFI